MNSLVGKWKLDKSVSDISYAGLDSIPGAPLVLRLLGNSNVEFYKIEKKKTLEVEEIVFSYVVRNSTIMKSVQIATLNFEYVSGNDVTLSFIQNCNEAFTELTWTRMGPKAGQSSREIYELDAKTDSIKLQIEFSTPDGTYLNMIKHLVRFDTTHVSQEVCFVHTAKTMGWKQHDFWPTTVLTQCQAVIVEAQKIRTQSPAHQEKTRVVERIWVSKQVDGSDPIQLDPSSVAHHFGYKSSEGEEVVEFVIRVTVNGFSWFVTHRYKEFDALRTFLITQNSYNKIFRDIDLKFPGKIVGLAYRKNAFEQRVSGLQEFLRAYLDNATYCKQSSVDALCSFLMIPENITLPASTTSRTTKSSSPSPVSAPPPPMIAPPTGSGALRNPIPAAAPSAPSNGKNSVVVTKPAANSSASKPPLHPQTTTGATPVHTPVPPGVQKPVAAGGITQDTARTNLLNILSGNGFKVIKHGRQGTPKERFLKCDANLSIIFWHGETGKSIRLSDVTAIRRGIEIDPASPKQKCGTAILRRHCKPEQMDLCFSLILPDRTFDIQCENQQDFNTLYVNLLKFLSG